MWFSKIWIYLIKWDFQKSGFIFDFWSIFDFFKKKFRQFLKFRFIFWKLIHFWILLHFLDFEQFLEIPKYLFIFNLFSIQNSKNQIQIFQKLNFRTKIGDLKQCAIGTERRTAEFEARGFKNYSMLGFSLHCKLLI